MEDRVFRVWVNRDKYATGWLAKYPRCIVTARHVTPTKVGDRRDTQRVARTDSLGTEATDKFFNDLRVIWTEAKEGNRKLTFDGQPFEIAEPTMTGVRDVAVNNFPAAPTFLLHSDLRGPQTTLYGYGAFDSSFHGWRGPLRRGNFRINGKTDGSGITPAVDGIILHNQADNGDGSCDGDSGGPVVQNGKVVAVHSGSTNADCSPNYTDTGGYTHHPETSLETALLGAPKAWLEEAIERVCGKTLTVGTIGFGRVEGTLEGGDAPAYADTSINKAINCPFDCSEMIHDGQSMTLTAHPEGDAEFIVWSGDRCPCAGTDDPECPIDDSIGEYGPDVSVDSASCHAHFTDYPTEYDYCDTTLYLDSDGDGFGDPSTADDSCPSGQYVEYGDDCDDNEATTYPWATELCDGVDNDCNGEVDDYCYDEDGEYTDPYNYDMPTYDEASTEVESCEDVALDPAMCTDDGEADPHEEATGDTYTEEPPESPDPSSSFGSSLSISCGSEWFDAPEDGAGFWVYLSDGTMAEGYTSGGSDHWCAPGAWLDASDWGMGSYMSTGVVTVQTDIVGAYCNGGEVTAEEACTSAW